LEYRFVATIARLAWAEVMDKIEAFRFEMIGHRQSAGMLPAVVRVRKPELHLVILRSKEGARDRLVHVVIRSAPSSCFWWLLIGIRFGLRLFLLFGLPLSHFFGQLCARSLHVGGAVFAAFASNAVVAAFGGLRFDSPAAGFALSSPVSTKINLNCHAHQRSHRNQTSSSPSPF
jgi:hypothetical protein